MLTIAGGILIAIAVLVVGYITLTLILVALESISAHLSDKRFQKAQRRIQRVVAT